MAKLVRRTWHGQRAKAAVRDGEVEGVTLGAEHLLGASRAVVPIQEAILSDSGTASLDKATATAAVSYDTPYAARQHEELEWEHDAGRTAKYLERPMHEEAAAIRGIVAAQIRKKLAK